MTSSKPPPRPDAPDVGFRRLTIAQASNLCAARVAAGLTYNDAAALLGLRPADIDALENARATCDIGALLKVYADNARR